MCKPKVLIQLDGDPHASSFDAVVALDSGVDHLLQYHGVEPTQVESIVHGAMFTRGPADLSHTAIFIGGSNVRAGELLLKQVSSTFFGPFRVSVMLDANGANTTAAAAVLAAARHMTLSESRAAVLAGTGPVGQRVARMLAGLGTHVRLCSRDQSRADEACRQIQQALGDVSVTAVQTSDARQTAAALEGVDVVVSAGAAGVQLLPQSIRHNSRGLRVAIDLNAVPPLGLEGTEVNDKAVDRQGVLCYGAIGVGGTKMKIHKHAIRQLFLHNDQILDAEQILTVARTLET
jgi:hypothetical protein